MPSTRPLQRSAHYRSLLGSCKRLALMTRNAGNSSVYARAAHAINTLTECDPVRSCSHDTDRTPRSLFALAFQRANCRPRNEYKGRRRQKAECRARNAQTNEQTKEIPRRQPPSERCCATPVLKLADGRAVVTRSLVSERQRESSHHRRWSCQQRGVPPRREGTKNVRDLSGAQVMTAPILQLNELNTPIRRCAAERGPRGDACCLQSSHARTSLHSSKEGSDQICEHLRRKRINGQHLTAAGNANKAVVMTAHKFWLLSYRDRQIHKPQVLRIRG